MHLYIVNTKQTWQSFQTTSVNIEIAWSKILGQGICYIWREKTVCKCEKIKLNRVLLSPKLFQIEFFFSEMSMIVLLCAIWKSNETKRCLSTNLFYKSDAIFLSHFIYNIYIYIQFKLIHIHFK